MLDFPSGRWLGGSVLEPSADAYVAYLQRHGYAATSVRGYLRCVEHLAYWLSARRIPLRRLDDALVRQFLSEHLPACSCPGRWQRTPHQVRAALRHLLRVLRAAGHIEAVRNRMPTTIQDELERFDAHLTRTCGLAPATRRSRLRGAGAFLRGRFGSTPIRLDAISAGAVTAFIVRPDDDPRPGRARELCGALRSYFRFRAVTCGDRVDGLIAAIPTVAQWRLAALPPYLTSDELCRFLGAFDRARPGGRRGYAMARCMVDLGLRAGEVAALTFEDFNWPDGTLTIRRSKSRRADVLPLPVPTGQAIVEYVRRARPHVTSRSLFVRHHAPLDAPFTTTCVRSAIRLAYAHCGLAQRYTGTHVLRHTAATRMRCAGASLKDIADVLRHRSLDTTTTYTKVDQPRLAAVAAPWPGGAS